MKKKKIIFMSIYTVAIYLIVALVSLSSCSNGDRKNRNSFETELGDSKCSIETLSDIDLSVGVHKIVINKRTYIVVRTSSGLAITRG